MILVGIGANLPHPDHGSSLATCTAALRALDNTDAVVQARSSWYESAPVPRSDQPWYVNGVVALRSARSPGDLLAVLHRIERRMGRVRSVRNAARTLDLDLLCFHDHISRDGERGPVLPHPRLQDRAFVLFPLRDVAPAWRHPVSGLGIDRLIAALPAGQEIRVIP